MLIQLLDLSVDSGNMSAITHEIRNLSGAVLVVHKNLSRLPGLLGNEDFRALGTLIEGLGKLSAMELKPAVNQHLDATELSSVLDELRVLLEPSYLTARLESMFSGVCRTSCHWSSQTAMDWRRSF